jgi:hypothetical protein
MDGTAGMKEVTVTSAPEIGWADESVRLTRTVLLPPIRNHGSPVMREVLELGFASRKFVLAKVPVSSALITLFTLVTVGTMFGGIDKHHAPGT